MDTESKQLPLIYLVYAQKDEELKQEFEEYLIMLQQSKLITGWVERVILPGVDASQEIDQRIMDAGIMVVLISRALCISGYCTGAELREACSSKLTGGIRVIPVLLRHLNLQGLLFENMYCLPRNQQPVASWADREEAWEQIDQEIRKVLMRRY